MLLSRSVIKISPALIVTDLRQRKMTWAYDITTTFRSLRKYREKIQVPQSQQPVFHAVLIKKNNVEKNYHTAPKLRKKIVGWVPPKYITYPKSRPLPLPILYKGVFRCAIDDDRFRSFIQKLSFFYRYQCVVWGKRMAKARGMIRMRFYLLSISQ